MQLSHLLYLRQLQLEFLVLNHSHSIYLSKYLYSKSRAEALLRLSIKTFSGNENLIDYIRDRMIEYQTEKSKEFLELSIPRGVSNIGQSLTCPSSLS